MKQKHPLERAVVVSDLHIPFHDEKSVQAVLSFIKWFSPEVVVLNGDVMDMFSASSFLRSPLDAIGLNNELALGEKFLKTVRKTAPKATIVYNFGNHEHRLAKFIIQKAPDLCGLKGLTLEFQLGVSESVDTLVNTSHKENYWKYGDCYIGHWDKASKHAGYAAKALVEDKGVSIVQGHTHKIGTHYRKRLDGTVLFGVEYGCLCDLNPKWIKDPNWGQGICILWNDNGTVTPQIVPIYKNHFIVNGMKW